MLRPWELNVTIVRESSMAIHVQIAQQIIIGIHNGRFTAGTALPGSRDLAKKISVNRKTVIQAYDELVAQGWLVSEKNRGTFISSKAASIKPSLDFKTISLTFDSRSKEPISIVSKQAHDHIHFNDGAPDNRLIPFEMMARAMRHALISSSRHLQSNCNDVKGALTLRIAILQMLNIERGLHANIDHICMLRNSQMGLFVIAKTIVHADDFVVFEQLSNPLARQAFVNCGANILNVAHDDEGMDISNLELLCEQYRIRAIYVTPQHQIPTAVIMSTGRREQLLALAERHNFLIIEDDTGHEYSFNNAINLPISSSAKSKQLVYFGSLSTVLGTGLNISYMVADKVIIDLCAKQINLIDHQSDRINEMAMTELFKNGEISRHRSRTLKIYQERRDYMIRLLHNELSEFASFNLPGSGLAIWLKINQSINMQKLLTDAEREKVSVMPANHYSSPNHQMSAIRLGYAHLNEDEMALGINRLKTAFMNQQVDLLRA